MFPEGRILDFLIVGVVALIVVGPKDLPVLMRRVGQFVGRMRAMAAEFRASFDEMARQSELDELRAEVEALKGSRPLEQATGVDEARKVIDDIDTSLRQGHTRLDPSQAWRSLPGVEPAAPPPESSADPTADSPPGKIQPKSKAVAGKTKTKTKTGERTAAVRRPRGKNLEASS